MMRTIVTISLSCCVLLLSAGQAYSTTKSCDLYNGSGCTTGFPFSFQYSGTNNVPNSQCKRTYQLQVNLDPGQYGFQCTFTMDVPEHNKYIYSISQSPTSTGSTPTSAYIYGYGLDARMRTRTAFFSSPYYANFINYNNIHTSADDNHHSTITFRVEDNRLRIYGSAGHSIRLGHSYLYRPTLSTTTMYIGLNRQYANTFNQGSGLCNARCHTF